MSIFFTPRRERFLRRILRKNPHYDICHMKRVTFVTLEKLVKVVDTIFVYPCNKLFDVQTI